MGAKALADLGVTVSSKAFTALRAKVVVEAVGDVPVLASVDHAPGIPALENLQGVDTSSGGFISKGKLQQYGYSITDLTADEELLVKQIVAGGDQTEGALTEELVDSVSQRYGLTSLSRGKYGGGSNNGFDHVYQTQDGMVYVLESKQVGSSGGLRLSQTVDGSVQMSNDWIVNVLGELEGN